MKILFAACTRLVSSYRSGRLHDFRVSQVVERELLVSWIIVEQRDNWRISSRLYDKLRMWTLLHGLILRNTIRTFKTRKDTKHRSHSVKNTETNLGDGSVIDIFRFVPGENNQYRIIVWVSWNRVHWSSWWKRKSMYPLKIRDYEGAINEQCLPRDNRPTCFSLLTGRESSHDKLH